MSKNQTASNMAKNYPRGQKLATYDKFARGFFKNGFMRACTAAHGGRLTEKQFLDALKTGNQQKF
jgi:hypothetical protein